MQNLMMLVLVAIQLFMSARKSGMKGFVTLLAESSLGKYRGESFSLADPKPPGIYTIFGFNNDSGEEKPVLF